MVPAKIIEKHKSAVKINPLQNIIRNDGLHKGEHIFFLLEIIIETSDKGISFQQMLVIPPLVQNLCAFLRLTDGIQHIAVALAVHCLLKSLDGEAQIDLVCCNILTDCRQIGSLDTVKKDKERKDLIICPSLFLWQTGIVSHIHIQIDLFRNPKIVHSLAVPVTDPGIFHIIEVI